VRDRLDSRTFISCLDPAQAAERAKVAKAEAERQHRHEEARQPEAFPAAASHVATSVRLRVLARARLRDSDHVWPDEHAGRPRAEEARQDRV